MTDKKTSKKEIKNTKDTNKKKESYQYSVKLSSAGNASKPSAGNVKKAKVNSVEADVKTQAPSPSPQKAAYPTPPPAGLPLEQSQQLQQSLEALKQNPEAMKVFQQLMKSQQPEKPQTLPQKMLNVAGKFTVSNMQKSAAISLKVIDSFVGFIVKKEGKGRNEVVQKARSPILFGLWVVIITFFIAGIWSGVAPLDKASHAVGFVVTDSKKQIIQHREGGILEELYVKEGEDVEAGQLLAKLSDKAIKSNLDGSRAQKNSFEKQLGLIREQLVGLEDLQQKGFVSKSHLMESQSKEAQLIAHMSDAESRILELEERLERLSIISPLTGIVNQIQTYTKGGTIPSGGTLMTITPKEDNLLIEAYVSPDDIDSVHIGLKSKVRISAFKHRSTGPLDGIVSFVSSDVFEPAQGHQSQEAMLLQRDAKGLKYKIRIEIDKEQLKKISKYRNYELYPGMQADVTIVTGERTLLQYLLDPITTTFWYAFKEQ